MSPDWIDHIHGVRDEELQRILNQHRSYFVGKDLLELGSGSGFQLEILSSICRSCIGLEISDSRYKDRAQIIKYDGKSIPFADASFDLIFSSQVLQYLTAESHLYSEMRRVLRSGGIAVHVVPTFIWRFWTSVLHYPARTQSLLRKVRWANARAEGSPAIKQSSARFPQGLANVILLHRLGARGNWFTEHFLFQARAWRRRLEQHGWRIEKVDPLDLWYTGHEMLGSHLSIGSRTALARLLGSSTITILAKPVTAER